jgi:photosystem II stability/assembly factor-like uncharacterized protein
MFRKIFSLVSFLLIFAVSSNAQKPWLKTFLNPNASFNEKREAFYKENLGKKAVRGSGIKHYNRWEWMAAQRLNEDGVKPPLKELWPEFEKVRARKMEKSSVGGSWTELGPFQVPANWNGANGAGIGRVNVIAFHPTDTNILWAGSPSGGIWKSTNLGETWSSNSDQFVNLGVSDIVIHPTAPDTMYLASGDRNGGDTHSYGVMKSTDGGVTWSMTGLTFALSAYVQVNALKMCTDSTQVLIAATSDGMYKTTDGGITWNQKSTFMGDDLDFMPGNDTILFSSGNTLQGQWTVFKSTDRGETWTPSGNGIPGSAGRMRIAPAPSEPGTFYAVVSDGTKFAGLYKSVDSASTWQLQSSSPNILGYESDGSDDGGQAWYDLDITVHPDNPNWVYVGGINTWVSYDAGATWICSGHWYGQSSLPYIHADQHFIGFQTGTRRLFSGCDGGVFYQNTTGNTWFLKSNNLSITQFYRLGTSSMSDKLILGGTQDNGTKFLKNNNWSRVQGGDGMESMVHKQNDQILFSTVYYGALSKSVDGGFNFFDVTPIDNGNTVTGAWVTPFHMDYTTPDLIFGGYNKVYATGDGGNTWSAFSPSLVNGSDPYLNSVVASKREPFTIYAARSKAIFRSTDLGGTWTNVTGNLSLLGIGINYIAIDDYDPSVVYVTLSGYADGKKVFKSTTGGTNWTNISGTLPNIGVNCIETEMSQNRGLYIGTEFGVFFKDNTMSDWEVFGQGFPNVNVTELEITEKFAKIRAATYGRGIWENSIINPVFDDTGVESFKVNDAMVIFPNPSGGEFSIKTDSPDIIRRVRVTNINGSVVFDANVNHQSSEPLVIHLSQWLTGIFTVEITTDKGVSRKNILLKIN